MRLTSAFWGEGGKAPVRSGAACLSGTACLHLQVEKGACSPALMVSLRGEKGGSATLVWAGVL